MPRNYFRSRHDLYRSHFGPRYPRISDRLVTRLRTKLGRVRQNLAARRRFFPKSKKRVCNGCKSRICNC